MRTSVISLFLTGLLAVSSSCSSVNDERTPDLPVNIQLADAGTWNSYGVNAFGSYSLFILGNGTRTPYSFPYTQTSATGFGGVLLISGMDPFSGATLLPLAYDLACPVERKPTVRIEIEEETFKAICPVCGSSYDVTMGGGAPLSGPASSSAFGLRRYRCIPTQAGGYLITN